MPTIHSSQTSTRDHVREDSPTWDVIVIGTGMGGAAAGAVCALNGLKTLILEKNRQIGGACACYEKHGFQVDVGAHLFIRGNSGPFGQLTRRLGMGYPIEFRHANYMVHLKGMNLDIHVPRNRAAMMTILPRLLWQLGVPPRHYIPIFRLFRDIIFMSLRNIEALDGVAIEDFVRRYTDDPRARSIIGMLLGLFFILPMWEVSAGESIWNLQKFILENSLGYPVGGAIVIPRTFLQGAQSYGAEVQMNAGVDEIWVNDNRVAGVVMENGERITARAVISTTSINDTIFRLAGRSCFPALYLQQMSALKPAWAAVQTKIALRQKLVRAGALVGSVPLKFTIHDRVIREATRNLENGIQGEMVPVYAPVPTNFDPGLAPPGCQIITAVAVAPTLNIPLQDNEQVWIDALMRALHIMVPGLKEHMIFADTWSVSELAGWTGKSSGSVITTGQTPQQVGSRRPDHRTPVKGLYLAGDNAGPARGVGTELACQSGMDCGDLVARDLTSSSP
ncbi:MAG: NAD(P)/FAD-dependent oxidoreductase [Thermodesulfobacteriota bacterium]|nr:NAD(P)/FAD-dependent oxidoreductase [Thermodesulfobacteriota bacterium]